MWFFFTALKFKRDCLLTIHLGTKNRKQNKCLPRTPGTKSPWQDVAMLMFNVLNLYPQPWHFLFVLKKWLKPLGGVYYIGIVHTLNIYTCTMYGSYRIYVDVDNRSLDTV